MKLAISNIAWDEKYDDQVYRLLNTLGYDGIEIAPTRWIKKEPYEHLNMAIDIMQRLKTNYSLAVASMQSIWYGCTEHIFGTVEERYRLIEYTKKAILFAESIGCSNIVFGSPKNRNMDDLNKYSIAVDFFSILGEFAYRHGVVIALEPNPIIYNTNFMNKTLETIKFIKQVNSKGLQVNLDLGTVIWNKENLDIIMKDINCIHHIHISEPYLEKIEKRDLHLQLIKSLKNSDYKEYLSIEMKNFGNIECVSQAIYYLNEVVNK